MPLDLSAVASAGFAHATGGVALALTVSGLVHASDQALRWRTGLAAVLWACHNAAIGAETAAAVNLLTVVRQGASMVLHKPRARTRPVLCGTFIALAVVLAVLTWEGVPTVAVLLASMLTSYAMFYLRGHRLRTAMFVVSALWLCNALIHQSVEQVLSIAATATASGYGAWRLKRQARLPISDPSHPKQP